MKSYKYHITLLLFFLNSTSILCQLEFVDVKDHYTNGKIRYDYQKEKRNKTFNNKMVFLQLTYESGKISKEYFRINDSTFLYTEYYDTIIIYPEPYYTYVGKKKEGYLSITNKLSGDTLTVIDYDTYEESVFLDTLMLPMGKWKYFYPTGELKQEGEFKKYERHGTWKYYELYRSPSKLVQYRYGEIENIKYQNLILENSTEITSNSIMGHWILRPANTNGVQAKEAEIDSINTLYKLDKVEGIGDIFTFHLNNQCELTETYIVKTEYENSEKGLNIIRKYDILNTIKGSWELTSSNEIEINLKDKVYKLKIEYLSKTQMRLLKEKALNNR